MIVTRHSNSSTPTSLFPKGVYLLCQKVGPANTHALDSMVRDKWRNPTSTMCVSRAVKRYTPQELYALRPCQSMSVSARTISLLSDPSTLERTKQGMFKAPRSRKPIRRKARHGRHVRGFRKWRPTGADLNNLCRIPCNNPQSFKREKCVLVNAQSVGNKTTGLCEMVEEENLDLVFITETWLKGDQRDDPTIVDMCPSSHKFLNFPRPTGGGGIGLMHRHDIDVKAVSKESETFEWVEVTISSRQKVLLVYRPPPSRKNKYSFGGFMRDFSDLLDIYCSETLPFIIVGDINIKVNRNQDTETVKYLDLLQLHGLHQFVDKPTHRLGNTLDHIIGRRNEKVLLDFTVEPSRAISDHFPVYFNISATRHGLQKETMTKQCRSLRKLNTGAFAADIQNCDHANSTSFEDYNAIMASLLDKHAPVKTVRIKGTTKKPWYCDKIHAARRHRRKLERRWKASGLEVHRQMVVQQCKAVVAMICRAKSVYFRDKLSTCTNKVLFREVNGLLTADRGNQLPSSSDRAELADGFACFFVDKIDKIRKDFNDPSTNICHGAGAREPTLGRFSSITAEELLKIIMGCSPKSCELDPIPTSLLREPEILNAVLPLIVKCINQSLSCGTVPDCLKTALVRPLLKKPGLDCEVMKNYRPISNLPFVSKMLEKVVARQLVQYMERNGLCDPLQSAYKAGHSTETALVKIKSDIDGALDRGQGVILVLLDMSAAFDTIDHGILLSRLESRLGISGAALGWFRSYLSQRTQFVQIDKYRSKPIPLNCGVPQGSVLGPLLFSIYIEPLGDIIGRHLFRHGFADDIQLYKFFDMNQEGLSNAISATEECVAEVRGWLAPNHLKGNDDKTEFSIIASKNNIRKLQPLPNLLIGNAIIQPSAVVRNLGAQFDDSMTMTQQISNIVKSMYFQIHRLSKIRRHLDDATCARVLNALVTSRLDFQNSLLLGLPNIEMSRLQRAQNSAARLLAKSRKREHITPILKQLHWLPVRQRVEYKVLTLIHAALHGLASPIYIKDLFTVYTPSRRLRSANDPWCLKVPHARGAYGDRSVHTLGPKLWNELPCALRADPCKNNFKKNLKTLIFTKTF